MSKRDKHNRFSEKPQFQEPRPIGEANKTVTTVRQNPKPIVYDPDEDEAASSFNFGGIGTFLGGCLGKLTALSKSAVSKTWNGCRSVVQWTWSGLRKIPSYCVIRWDTEDEAEVPDETAKKPTAAHYGSKGKTTSENNGFDEDELAPSRWWSLGIKAASVAAALLIIGGGYFAVKSLVFNTNTPPEVAETVETDGKFLASSEQPPTLLPPENMAPIAETAASAVPRQPEPVATGQNPESRHSSQGSSPSQGLQVNNDPFAQVASPPVTSTATPTIAESAPRIASDPFGPAPVASAPPAPPTPTPSQNSTTQNLAALQPLSPLDSAQKSQPQHQLQPLATLDSTQPSLGLAVAPGAAPATANAPVAAKYRDGNNRRPTQRTNPNFGEAPTPPVVNAMPQATVQQTMSVVQPMREIVPQIPPSGTVQEVLPPPAPPAPLVAEVSPARSVYANESVPAIPRDAPIAAASVPVVAVPVAVPVPANALATAAEASQIVSAESQLMDWQLWDQVRELREESASEPSSLQLTATTAATEPALRFTPKTASLTNVENSLLHEAADQFRALMPVDELDPNSGDLETRLPVLEHAPPQAVFGEALPKYRKSQTGSERSGERGMTFRNRINSEIKRSPAEMEKYVVQQGDTYMTISDKFYGTSLLYSALAEHNRTLGIGWNPAEGVVIEVPTAEYLRTYYNQQRRAGTQRPTVRYIVQEGDTIFRLATDKLQDTNRWREIYAMNSDRIQDVRDLKPGMEILLPAESARTNRQQIQ